MNQQFLQRLRTEHSGKIGQVNGLLERVQREGIESFIANVEQSRANLIKAEADLKAVCLLVGIPLEDEFTASPAAQAESKQAGRGPNIPGERIMAAVTSILTEEPHKGFTISELETKTSFTNVQVRKELKKLVNAGKVAETIDPTAKRRGFPTKIYTWKG